jgi:demethylspheroidene O-methyltransferase
VALLRRGGGGGALARYWTYAEHPGDGTAEEVHAYSRLMGASQPLVATQILQSYRFAQHRRILDIGGGEGRFLEAVAAAVPTLDLALFDLPAVADRARTRLAAAGLGARSVVHAGSFLHDALPTGYDLITLVRVLHDHDDGPALTVLRAIHAALPRGGCLLIAEPMAQTRGAEPAGDAYFGLYLLAMGSGRPRTPREIDGMLRAAGFDTVRLLSTAMPLTCRVMLARRN